MYLHACDKLGGMMHQSYGLIVYVVGVEYPRGLHWKETLLLPT